MSHTHKLKVKRILNQLLLLKQMSQEHNESDQSLCESRVYTCTVRPEFNGLMDQEHDDN